MFLRDEISKYIKKNKFVEYCKFPESIFCYNYVEKYWVLIKCKVQCYT